MKKKGNALSLRAVVFLISGIILIAFVIAFFSVVRISMSKMLTQAENRYLEEHLRAAKGILETYTENAYRTAGYMATLEETAAFVLGQNTAYIRRNWPGASPLELHQLHFLLIKDTAGNDLYVEFFDYSTGAALSAPVGFSAYLNTFIEDAAARGESRPGAAPESSGCDGIAFYQDIPYLFVAMPVMPAAPSQSPVGTVVLGYILDHIYQEEFHHFEGAEFNTRILPGERPQEQPDPHGNFAYGAIPLEDVAGNLVELTVTFSRELYMDGLETVSAATLLLAAVVVLFIALLYLVIVRLVIGPIIRLSRDIAALDTDNDVLTARDYSGSAEFEALCGSINGLLAGLRQSGISLHAFQNILNEMDAYIHVTDLETDELLFVNSRMAESFDVDVACSGPCWKALGTSAENRCEGCPVPALIQDPHSVVSWEREFAAQGKIVKNIDWVTDWTDNRKVHLQYSSDITQNKRIEENLKRQLAQQELMSKIAKALLSTEDLPALITDALRLTGEFFDASKVLISAVDKRGYLTRKYSWCNQAQGVMRVGNKQKVPFRAGSTLYNAFMIERKPYLWGGLALEEDCPHLTKLDILSYIVVPLYTAGNLWGVLTLGHCFERSHWTEGDVSTVMMIGNVLSELVTRGETETELQRMSAIVDSSPEFISYIRFDGKVEYVNNGAESISGYTAEELMHGGIRLIFSPDDCRMLMEKILPQINSLDQLSLELPLLRKDGGERTLLLSLFTTGFKGLGFGVMGSDITEKQQLERELVAAKELAEQSSRSKSDFLSRMSHEMRTPMNAIIGMTNIARSTAEGERKEYCLEKIDKASNHLLGVINDILDMSKIEANKFELSYTDFNFEKMLMRVMGVIRFLVDEKKQMLTVKLEPDVPGTIVSDEQRLAQVITNLLSNAVKFTPEEGFIQLHVRSEGGEGELCTLRIDVVDNGIGISEEQQAKLFHSFEQADGGISRKFGGTGLGLAISKRIVEMMDGEMWVQSEFGKGSTFSFTIRVRRGTALQARYDADASWKNLRVLLVDDSPDVYTYFSSVAQSFGIRCDMAVGCDEAKIHLEDGRRYDLVFVEWALPGLPAAELTYWIKEQYGDSVVVVAISATEWMQIESEIRLAGADKFLPKPLFASSIADCINEFFGAEKPDAAPMDAGEENCFKGCHILLAEDIDINREILITLLEPTGVRIDIAEDGQVAYDRYRASPEKYDMIFMDIHMPEVDGYESTRRIRTLDHPLAKTVPIVAMTANVFREDIDRCLAAGMNDHVGKPLDMDDVIAKMHKYLPKKG